MGFQVSPGVQVKEIDLTNVIPAVSTSIGAIAGAFQWGPVGEIITVGSEKQLVSRFGEPNNDTFSYFMPAASFLKYGKSLRVVRADATGANASTAALNASSGVDEVTVGNDDIFDDGNLTTLTETVGSWIAKFPGTMGNGLTVNVVKSTTTPDDITDLFDTLPDADEIHVAVVDSLGNFGTPGVVIETFAFLSTVEGSIGIDGTNNFFVDVINATSNYIRSNPFSGFDDPVNVLSGGTASPVLDLGDLKDAYDLFADTETVDVNLIIQGPANADRDLANHLIFIAQDRKDCVAFVSPPIATTKQNINATTDLITWADGLTSSSYGVIDSTALYVYDKYSDVYRWIAASGAVAGLCAKTDDVADPWWSPAGFNRGQLFGVTKLAFNPKHFERDDLYKKRINPIVTFPGEGTLLYGDKTAQSKPSAFDRINVRRLFIVLEKAIATAAKYQLFEFNDEFTRAQFRNMVEPFLRDVKGRRGLYDFHVVCDETNNTGQVIDTNQFIADIYIKPARSINFMTLNFIATRTGVEFSEIIGK
jgi:phage tail sheath protein FI